MLKHNDKGNALFLVLIAVALFAALSYAVTQSGRGGGNTDRENASLIASQILQYASLVESTITRMRLVNGCRDIEISFDTPSLSANYTNPSAPADLSCHVFEENGGALQFIDEPDGNDEWLFSGSVIIQANLGPPPFPEADLTIMLPRISAAVCQSINRSAGINHAIDNVPLGINSLAEVPFVGDYTTMDGVTDPVLTAPPAICFREGDSDNLFFISTLIVRSN